MDKGSILVREVCGKNTCGSNFEAIIQTKAPIKEVYEIRHQILKPKVLIGKNAIALFGKILIKAYCISSENSELFLSEQTVSYKGFILGEFKFHEMKPFITINSGLEGIFNERVESNKIKITGIISTELLFSLEKVIKLSQLMNLREDDPVKEDSRANLIMMKPLDQTVGEFDAYTDYTIEDEPNDCEATKEIHTELSAGTNQEFTIILD